MRALWARVTPADQDKLLWAPHLIDWRDVLARHALPGPRRSGRSTSSTRSSARSRSRVYTYKELVEMFEATVKLHRNRPALRLLPQGTRDASRSRTPTARWASARGRAPACCASSASAAGRPRRSLMSREPAGVGHHVLRDHARGRGRGAARQGADARRGREPRARSSSAKAIVLSRKVAERLAGEADIAVPVGRRRGRRRSSVVVAGAPGARRVPRASGLDVARARVRRAARRARRLGRRRCRPRSRATRSPR